MNENSSVELLKSIYKLRHKTVKEIAEESSMHFTNLMDAMAGRRRIPSEKFADLSQALGLTNGKLISEKLHYWVVGLELHDLIFSVEYLFKNGCEIVGVWREGTNVFDLSRVFDKQIFLIYDDLQLVVVIRKRIGVHAPTAQPISPELFTNAKWRGGSVGSQNMLSLPVEIFKKLQISEITDPNVVRKKMGNKTTLSWDNVIDYIKERWRDPISAFDVISKL